MRNAVLEDKPYEAAEAMRDHLTRVHPKTLVFWWTLSAISIQRSAKDVKNGDLTDSW